MKTHFTKYFSQNVAIAVSLAITAISCRSKIDIYSKANNAKTCCSNSEVVCKLTLSSAGKEVKTIDLNVGDSANIAASFDRGSDKVIASTSLLTLSGCNESILKIEKSDQDIKLSGSAKGNCTLTVSATRYPPANLNIVVRQPIKSILISPQSKSANVGSSVNFTALATLTDNSTEDITASAAWTSDPKTAISFDSQVNGRGTIAGTGTISVYATLGDKTGEAKVQATSNALKSIYLVDPGIPNYLGVQKKYQAIGIYADGKSEDITNSVNWTSANTAKATIDDSSNKGLANLLDPGSTSITADLESVSASRSLVVGAPTLSSLVITPANLPIASGYKANFKVTGTYSDGIKLDLTSSATWTTSNAAVATVDNSELTKGIVTGVGTGTATITASVLSSSATATVAVTSATLASISLTPSSLTKPANTSDKILSEGRFSDNSVLDFSDSTQWTSNSANVTVSSTSPSKGRIVANQTGSAIISSTSASTSGTANVTVSSATLVSIAIVPSSLSLTSSDQRRFIAIGTFSDASTHDISDRVTWTSSDSTKAFVSDFGEYKGMVPGLDVGTAVISASLGAISGSSSVTVASSGSPTISSIQVTPSTGVISGTSTQQFTATAFYSDGTTANISGSSVWSSAVGGVATVNAGTGLVTGVASGSTLISATKDSVTGSALAIVTFDQAAPPAPTTLSGTANSTTSVTFNWTTGGGSTASYKYAFQSGGAAPANCNAGTTGIALSSTVTLSSLSPGTQYSMIVCALNTDMSPDMGVASGAASMYTKPATPTGLTATTASTTTIDLSWADMSADTGGYKIAYKSGAVAPVNCNSDSTTTAAANATSQTISSLSPNTQYTFIICTVNSDSGQSSPSAGVSGNTDTTPATPTSFTATASTSVATTIALAWDNMAGDAGGYKIAYKSGAVAPADCNSDTTTTAAADSTSKNITGLTAGTQYTFIICTINATATMSSASSGVSSTTIPLTPTGFGAVVNATTPTTQIDLSWANMAGDSSGYKIAYRPGASSPADCNSDSTTTAAVDATSTTVTGLTIATQYTFIICTVNSVSGQSVPASGVSIYTLPAVPTTLAATAVSTTGIDLTWDNMANDTGGYKIAYKSGGVAPASCTSDSTTTAVANATSKSISGLTAGNRYTFVICTVDTSAGDSARSAGVSMYTKTAAPSISATVDSSSQITLSWVAITGDTGGYKIAYKSGGVAPVNCDSDTTTTAASAATSKVISGLTASTQYTFIACTVNSDSGQSASSTSATGTTSAGGGCPGGTSAAGGACWVRAADSQSCSGKCALMGLASNDTATEDYAGSGGAGSDANCKDVVDTLEGGNNTITENGSPSCNLAQLGCMKHGSGYARCTIFGTSPSASQMGIERYCACQ
ncbi:MAG: fibronectin type III domain-containing protein [Proteobacteria bacterium]|nr:fibronectin type III domain-containing protein [Pseudomonadota bacterium]